MLVYEPVDSEVFASFSEVTVSQTPSYNNVTGVIPSYSEVNASQTPSYSDAIPSQSPDWDEEAA